MSVRAFPSASPAHTGPHKKTPSSSFCSKTLAERYDSVFALNCSSGVFLKKEKEMFWW